MHPKLESRGGFKDHQGPPPLIEGTVVGLKVEHLPGNRDPKPLWLWVSKPVPEDGREMDHWWSMYLRRFDIEHTFRFLKQNLGWTRPHLREPAAADRWTWIVLAAHTLLRLVRPMAVECRLPWQQPMPPARLTPARVRATYRRACRDTVHPANPPLASTAGPGRPRGGRQPEQTRGPARWIGPLQGLNAKLRDIRADDFGNWHPGRRPFFAN